MLKLETLERTERTENGKALSVIGNGNGSTTAQSLESWTAQLYCERHGVVKSYNGHCELCYDEGYRDWVAVQSAKELIPSWTGIEPNGRTVIVTRVRDALEAVEKIGQYKNADALVLIIWDTLVTALDRGRIGPSWTLPENGSEDDSDFVTCARCGQDFRPLMGDERVCESCWRIENGPRW